MPTQRNRNSALIWRKSSASGGNAECVEVASSELSVLVRDTRNRSGAMLQFSSAQWRGFVGRIKHGLTMPVRSGEGDTSRSRRASGGEQRWRATRKAYANQEAVITVAGRRT